MKDATRILTAIDSGDPQAANQLLPLVYDELRRLAAAKLANEKPGQTLQATALVHEAYLRLVGGQASGWKSRGHFFAAAAEAMRRILVDQARRKLAAKRGGHLSRSPLDMHDVTMPGPDVDLLAINDALEHFERMDRQAADFIKLRYFSGFTVAEAAEALAISAATADRVWAYARAWLHDALKDQGSS